jgi:ribosomal protein S18 acetylase RimI-like enzyme
VSLEKLMSTVALAKVDYSVRRRYMASTRLNIESVRVDEKYSNQGIGSWMMKKAIEFGRENNAKIIQLTSNKQRKRAHKFYEKLGFEATHEGMKLNLINTACI